MSLVYRGSSSSKKNKTWKYIIVLYTMTFKHIPSTLWFGMFSICSSFDWWVQAWTRNVARAIYDSGEKFVSTCFGKRPGCRCKACGLVSSWRTWSGTSQCFLDGTNSYLHGKIVFGTFSQKRSSGVMGNHDPVRRFCLLSLRSIIPFWGKTSDLMSIVFKINPRQHVHYFGVLEYGKIHNTCIQIYKSTKNKAEG